MHLKQNFKFEAAWQPGHLQGVVLKFTHTIVIVYENELAHPYTLKNARASPYSYSTHWAN